MIYFDNAATTPVFESVAQAQEQVTRRYFANPSSLHALGVETNGVLEKARTQFEQILNVLPRSVFFTSSGTESNNTAILGTAFAKTGKHIITTSIEHPSVRNPIAFLEKMGYEVTVLPVNKQGVIDVVELKKALREDTILVSMMWVNNEIGVVQPIVEVAQLLQDYPKVHFHVDAVQALEQVLKNGIPERVDLLSLSAHKFHGVRGVGVFYKKPGRVIAPLLHGGGQESNLRSSTQNTAGIVASAKALREYRDNDVTPKQLKQAVETFLKQYEKVVVLSSEVGASHIVTFALPGVRGEVMVHALADKDIYVSTTSACSSKVKSQHHTLGAMGVDDNISKCAVRMSFSKYNTLAEVEQFKRVFVSLYEQFSKII